LGHPRKYAFILRFISPELIQSLKYARLPLAPAFGVAGY